MSKHSIFVVCDGPSGSGKDSLIKALIVELERLGLNCSILSEEDLDPNRAEILLARKAGIALGGTGDIQMSKALVEHRALIYSKYLLPMLKNNICVLGNRGLPATLAYQTARNEITMEEVWKLHIEAGIYVPDLVILTKCKPKTAVSREESDNQTQENTDRVKRESGKGLSGKVTNESGVDPFAATKRRELIHNQFKKTVSFLSEKGVALLVLNTDMLSVGTEVKRSLKTILKMCN